MNNLKWMGHLSTIETIYKTLEGEGDVLITSNGSYLRAHRIVLASCSEMLHTALRDVPLGEEATIMVPDIKIDVLQNILHFIYNGESCIIAENLSEFLEAINVLGITSEVSFFRSPKDQAESEVNEVESVTDKSTDDLILNEPFGVCIEYDESTQISDKFENKEVKNDEEEIKMTDIEEEMKLLTENFSQNDSNDSISLDESEEQSSGGVHEIVQNAYDLAVDAVISQGLSLKKSAEKFGLSKTVLWRRVHKSPYYVKPERNTSILKEAYERLKNGEQLKRVSKDLNIPVSTLHRHRTRLIKNGDLPDNLNHRRISSSEKKDLRQRLFNAMNVCIHEGTSLNQTAIMFDLPKSTLWRHLQKRQEAAKLTMGITDADIDEIDNSTN